MNIGVISDTHGLVRPEALVALRESDLILHAGDIGSPQVLQELETIAHVTAIRGNNDEAPWARRIPTTLRLEVEDVSIYLLHNLKELPIDPAREALDIVIAGHSHRPSIERRDGVLFVNPGSAGPRRFKLPITVAKLKVDGAKVHARIVELDVGKPRKAKSA
jgi:putative phosphoesterase